MQKVPDIITEYAEDGALEVQILLDGGGLDGQHLETTVVTVLAKKKTKKKKAKKKAKKKVAKKKKAKKKVAKKKVAKKKTS